MKRWIAVAVVTFLAAGGAVFAESCEEIKASSSPTNFKWHDGKADSDTHPCGTYQFCIFADLSGDLRGASYSYFSNWSWAVIQPGAPFAAHYSWGDTIIDVPRKGQLHGRERVVVVGDAFVSLMEISGGTGEFENASGVLYLPGGGPPDDSRFDVLGEICIP